MAANSTASFLIRKSKTAFLPFFISIVFLFVLINPVRAWVYPEHRNISYLAIQNLNPIFRGELNRLWKEARTGFESRLTETPIAVLGRKTTQLDFASWPAIAGDHSCSPENMLNTILHTSWILKVADVAALLDNNLTKAKTRSQRINALHLSDMQLIKADDDYATRAGANSAHFLLPRTEVSVAAMDYFAQCIKRGAELNAIGIYIYFHSRAISKAKKYASGSLSSNETTAILLAAFADEAFALHFLEDAFAAGHIAGTRGNASLQKGTHDYYNEAGIETQSWDGKRRVVMGDANMRKEDEVFVAGVIQKSLESLLDAANGSKESSVLSNNTNHENLPDNFNVCTNTQMPDLTYDTSEYKAVLLLSVVPGLSNGVGELPRFRAELGAFFGVSAALNGSSLNGGFGKDQIARGTVGGLEANLRFGLGLDGVLNRSGDGLVFLQMGWKQESSSTNNFIYSTSSVASNSIASAIPARAAYNLRIRLPFYLIPGDLILASPLLLFAPKTYSKMAVAAVNGGLIPWQSGIATGIGRLQFILGREIGISFYGLKSPKDFIIIPTTGVNSAVVEFRSTKFDFPILEFRPLRSFSQDQTSSLMMQINAGFDMPYNAKTIVPVGDPLPGLKTVWYVGLRVLFNWRHYF